MNPRLELRRWYEYGADALPAAERRRVRVGNLIALAGCAITLAYGLVYLFVFGSVMAFAVNAASSLAYLSNFVLLSRGRPLAARVGMFVVFLVNLFCLVTLFFGTRSGVHLYYVLVGPVAFFLFDEQHRAWRYGLAAASVLLFLLCEALPSAALVIDLPPMAYRAMFLTTVPLLVVVMLLVQATFLQETAAREASLDQAARTDELTRVPNRRAAYEQATALFRQARRHGQPFAVMMVDVDLFKAINDAHGHAAGDEVLSHIAGALRSMLRAEDVLGRFGGEEFLVALSQVTEGDDLEVAEKLRHRIAEQRVPIAGGEPVRCTISVGLARAEATDVSFDLLLARADRALYRAKDLGRNRVVVAGSAPERV